MKARSPKDMIARHLTTQNRVKPPKMSKRRRDIIKMKATDSKGLQAKPFFLKTAKHVPQERSAISMKQGQQSRS